MTGKRSYRTLVQVSLTVLLLLVPFAASAQEVGLVKLDVKDVAKGYRGEALKQKPVVNDKNETIGHIDDYIFGHDGQVFAVLAVGDFTGLNGNLVAVPFNSLKLDEPLGQIMLAGASRSALLKLPVFLYNH
jgi:hypothetical protein